ncbi:MAG: T9SS type A sorting domain-containing protein, partial [Bacteroidetes bacterium]|nr:T9SS type A sorting domain-containing protein [Bacteroidota bacterium]
ICQGDSITLDPGTGADSYLWSTNDATQTITASTAGNYKVTATGTNGCSISDSTNLIVNALPIVTAISSAPEVCDGNQATLTGSGTGTGTLTYTWNHNVTNQLPFTPTSTETYTLTGIDANNCENTDMITVIVNPLPIVTGTATAPEICIGDSVTLTGSGASTIIWDNNVDDTVPFAPSTTETYTVTGTDANNCSSTDSVTVVVNLLPIVEANVSASAVCEGEQVTLMGSGADTYTWDNNNVIDNVPFVPLSTLSYIVTGVDTNNCSNTDQITVTVNPLPIVIANATATAVCFGDDVTLSGSGADSYFWTNGVTDSVAFNPTATLSYMVTGTDANNCSNTDEITITVNPLPDVTLENFEIACLNFPEFDLSGGNPVNGTYLIGGTNPVTSFNPSDFTVGIHAVTYTYTDVNGCTSSAQGLIEVSECTSIAETAFGAGSVKVYPNPAFNQFTLEVNAIVNEAAEIMVYNSNGKIVKVEKTNLLEGKNNIKFETSEFARGVYYIQVLTNTNNIQQKVVLN